jgi:hypothetical protein
MRFPGSKHLPEVHFRINLDADLFFRTSFTFFLPPASFGLATTTDFSSLMVVVLMVVFVASHQRSTIEATFDEYDAGAFFAKGGESGNKNLLNF